MEVPWSCLPMNSDASRAGSGLQRTPFYAAHGTLTPAAARATLPRASTGHQPDPSPVPVEAVRVGQMFGRLRVPDPNRRLHGKRSALCRCSCGTEKIIRGEHFARGTNQELRLSSSGAIRSAGAKATGRNLVRATGSVQHSAHTWRCGERHRQRFRSWLDTGSSA